MDYTCDGNEMLHVGDPGEDRLGLWCVESASESKSAHSHWGYVPFHVGDDAVRRNE